MNYSFNEGRVVAESHKELQLLISLLPVLDIESICEVNSKDEVSIDVKLDLYCDLG